MSAPRSSWVISDGRRGIENQALGLAEALAKIANPETPLEISSHYISRKGLAAKLPAFLQKWLKPEKALSDDLPDIAIGCGRMAIAPLIKLKAKGVLTVYVQDPRIDPANFDVVIAPQHDGLTGDNVLTIIGAPNRITPERLAADKDMIKPKGAKTAVFLIGGKSKTHQYTPALINAHAEQIADFLNSGWEVFLTTSRRTPIRALEYFSHFDRDFEEFHLYGGRGPNPYFAYLHHADIIFVTEDSTNMLTEAASTGKPVFRLAMSGHPGKFQTLYDALESRCRLRPAAGSDLALQSYAPLSETARAAKYVWNKFHNRV